MASEAGIVKIKNAGVEFPERQPPMRYMALYQEVKDAKLNKPFELFLEPEVILENASFNTRVFGEENLQAFEIEVGKNFKNHSLVIRKTRRGKKSKK